MNLIILDQSYSQHNLMKVESKQNENVRFYIICIEIAQYWKNTSVASPYSIGWESVYFNI